MENQFLRSEFFPEGQAEYQNNIQPTMPLWEIIIPPIGVFLHALTFSSGQDCHRLYHILRGSRDPAISGPLCI